MDLGSVSISPKTITKSGGIGVSDSVQREMLKLQGLEDAS